MERKIAGRYARALFEVALEEERLEEVFEQLGMLAKALREQEEIAGLLCGGLVPEEGRRSVLERMLELLEAGELLRRFVALLLERRRTALLPLIAERFEELFLEHRGIVRAELQVARELAPEVRQRLAEALGRYMGKQAELSEKVEPGLIAGLRVQVGSLLIDGTLERQLRELERKLLG